MTFKDRLPFVGGCLFGAGIAAVGASVGRVDLLTALNWIGCGIGIAFAIVIALGWRPARGE